ncbi:MAG: hopanoid C-3 methylase HpnR [Anaerolineales bacterium]|nr:hopanoid C-3 methylase HpnR [Anaerolineales bacterium]
MKVLFVHPSGLLHTRAFLRLEPLGLELVAQAARQAGCQAQLVDLQVEQPKTFHKILSDWQPEVVAFSCNYLANIPEIVDLAKASKKRLPGCFVLVGGHSASFTAEELLEHGQGAIDCVLRGESEAAIVNLLEAVRHDRQALAQVPGAVSEQGYGPPPTLLAALGELRPARDLLRKPRRYFIADLDPCASIEFSRGCPWDCSFCSGWIFYGRSYRRISTEVIVDELAHIREPNVFVVDDVALIQASNGFEIGEAIARKGIKKTYYMETRGDVLLRNKEMFRFWKDIGLGYMFLGLEAIDAEGLERFRKRTSLDKNLEALEFARSLDIVAAINLIADPDWDHARFEVVRKFCQEIPEIVNLSVFTPYPGTEAWYTNTRPMATSDYRLFDIQHSVLPTRLPLAEFYRELVETQKVVYNKYLGWKGLGYIAGVAARNLMHGQANFLKTFLNFSQMYNPKLQLADHNKQVLYGMHPPPPPVESIPHEQLYVHVAGERENRAIDETSGHFVESARFDGDH